MQRAGVSETPDTIAAIATPPGRGGIGVVRVSGPRVGHIARAIIGTLPRPRYAHYGAFLEQGGEPLDTGIALFFPAPNSYTGEDVLELQGHGGPVILDLVLNRVLSLGARQARPGEFSERAFLNGKLDLAQAEAVADLIESASESAVRSAMRSLQGAFSLRVRALVNELIALRAYVEGALDFPDEQIDFLEEGDIRQRIEGCLNDLNALLQEASLGHRLRSGLDAVIAGRPNVGKSSLLNRLARRERAIVSPQPGTTRDVLHEDILLDGLPLHVTDTAGLRLSGDLLEQEGIRRAREAVAQADLLLLVREAGHPPAAEERDVLDVAAPGCSVLIVVNKIDLEGEPPAVMQGERGTEVRVSAKTGEGLDLLEAQIRVAAGVGAVQESGFSARRRHLKALERGQAQLASALGQLQGGASPELIAEDLRLTQLAIAEVTGEFTADDLLGEIFASFCIGK